MSKERGGFHAPDRKLNIPSFWDLPEKGESSREFKDLREKVLRAQKDEIMRRVSSRPVPDEEELSAGAYRELIEPQCRKAIFEMRRKGYDTGSSGFGSGNAQIVDGHLPLTQATVDILVEHGYVVYEVGMNSPSIQFVAHAPDMEQITAKWNELAALLPDLGSPARPRSTRLDDFYNGIIRSSPELHLQRTRDGGLTVH